MNNWLKSKKGCQKLSIDNLLSIIRLKIIYLRVEYDPLNNL
jgi:hypothetical protein